MRPILAAVFSALITAAAFAQEATDAPPQVYYAERGHWTVAAAGPEKCMAINRPFAEVNHAPYNALQFVARRGFLIGVSVMFWPGAVEIGGSYKLTLRFDGANVITLDGTATFGDYIVESEAEENRDLWRQLQAGGKVTIAPPESLAGSLLFVLDDSAWLAATLRECVTYLPPP